MLLRSWIHGRTLLESPRHVLTLDEVRSHRIHILIHIIYLDNIGMVVLKLNLLLAGLGLGCSYCCFFLHNTGMVVLKFGMVLVGLQEHTSVRHWSAAPALPSSVLPRRKRKRQKQLKKKPRTYGNALPKSNPLLIETPKSTKRPRKSGQIWPPISLAVHREISQDLPQAPPALCLALRGAG